MEMVGTMSGVEITVCACIGSLLKVTARYTAVKNKQTLLTTDFMTASRKKLNWAKLTAVGWKRLRQYLYFLSNQLLGVSTFVMILCYAHTFQVFSLNCNKSSSPCFAKAIAPSAKVPSLFKNQLPILLILARSKAYPSILSRFCTQMGNALRHTACCDVGNLLQSQAKTSVIVAKWSNFEFDRQLHFATVVRVDN